MSTDPFLHFSPPVPSRRKRSGAWLPTLVALAFMAFGASVTIAVVVAKRWEDGKKARAKAEAEKAGHGAPVGKEGLASNPWAPDVEPGGKGPNAWRIGSEPVLPEEKIALAHIKKYYGTKGTWATEWGPHDLRGRLAKEVARRKARGQTEFFATTISLQLPLDAKVVRFALRYIDGYPKTADKLVVIKNGKAIFLEERRGHPSNGTRDWMYAEFEQMNFQGEP